MSHTIPCPAEGHFSVVDPTPFTIHAEPGLAIRVHAGWLWVPRDGTLTLRLDAGDRFVVRQRGTLLLCGRPRTHVELERPASLALAA
jgi:hypothetical protein